MTVPDDKKDLPIAVVPDASPKKDKGWLDITSKLLLPVVLGLLGFWIPYKTHQSDLSRQDAEARENKKRQQAEADENQKRIEFERETEFVRMLVSGNADEQQLAIALITTVPPNKRDVQVTAALTNLCAAPANPSSKNRACDALNPSIAQPTHRQPDVSQSSVNGPVVFLQIASETQRTDAEVLKATLAQANFKVEDIELVKPPIATRHTYIRFFQATGAVQAARIADVMNAMKYKAVGIQDFSAYADNNQSSLEIWIGSTQEKL